MQKFTIYTLAWKDDCAVGSEADDLGSEQQAMVRLKLFVDAVRIEGVCKARASFSDGFATLQVEIGPASLEIVECNAAEWAALDE